MYLFKLQSTSFVEKSCVFLYFYENRIMNFMNGNIQILYGYDKLLLQIAQKHFRNNDNSFLSIM